jgi:hypothetical protein
VIVLTGRVAPYLAEAHQQNQIVMDVIAQAAFCYAVGDHQVVCDGIVGPWFISGSYTASSPISWHTSDMCSTTHGSNRRRRPTLSCRA